MKIYLVGGAVRDRLLGKNPRDNDYLVLDSSPEEMEKEGYQEVGKSHTVYLHPETKEEYTLTTDLKTDLIRRDLTMNAMAMNDEGIIDYFGGREDIRNKILRHVRDQNFFTDPLRVYRVARFSAELPEFSIHPSTLTLMETIKDLPSFQNLDGERILLELNKALTSEHPEKFFETLKKTGVLPVHFADLSLMFFDKTNSPTLRYATLFFYSPVDTVVRISDRLKVSNEWRETALMASELLQKEKTFTDAGAVVECFQEYDVYRRPFRFEVMKTLFTILEKKQTAERLSDCYKITAEVSFQSVPANLQGKEIGEAIKNKRIKILQESNSMLF